MAVSAFSGLTQRLVFLVIDLPFDLIITPLAEMIERCRHDALRQFAFIVQLELGLVLVFLTCLFLVGSGHTDSGCFISLSRENKLLI